MNEKDYKLDWTVLKPMTVEDADDHVSYWNDKTEDQRLNAACFIINNIFSVTPYHKIDFAYTDKRKNS